MVFWFKFAPKGYFCSKGEKMKTTIDFSNFDLVIFIFNNFDFMAQIYQKKYFRSDYLSPFLACWPLTWPVILPHLTINDEVPPPVQSCFCGPSRLIRVVVAHSGSFWLVAALLESLLLLQTTPHEDLFPVEKAFENTSFV